MGYRLLAIALASIIAFSASALASCSACYCNGTIVSCTATPVSSVTVFPTSTTNLTLYGTSTPIVQDYGRFPNLQYLDLRSNRLTSVDEDQFQNVPKLKVLALDDNSFKSFPPKLLYHLVDLRLFGCMSNQLTYLPNNFFLKNRKLNEVWMGNNNIRTLPYNLFTGLVLHSFHIRDGYQAYIDNLSLCPISQVLSRGLSFSNLRGLKNASVDFMIDTCKGAYVGCYHDDNRTKFFCECPSGKLYGGRDLGCQDASVCRQQFSTKCTLFPTCTLLPCTLNYNCVCLPMLTLSNNGSNCQQINECAVNTSLCAMNEICVDTLASYYCTCKSGYYRGGGICTNANECEVGGFTPCATNEVCIDSPGSYTCQCSNGFSGSGRTCSDVNECSTTSSSAVTCPQNSTCLNTIGSYECRCDAGFQDILQPTSLTSPRCENIDECCNGQADCSADMLCKDTVGSYQCLCKTGFVWQGKDDVCENINECQTSAENPCTTTSQCIDTDGSFVCLPTWRGEALFPSSTSSKASDSTTSTTAAVQIATLAVGTILLACAIANLLVVSKVRKQQQCDKIMHLENAGRDQEMQEVILHPRPGFPSHARLGNSQAEPSTVTANIGSTSAPRAKSPRHGRTNINSQQAVNRDTSQQCGLVRNEAYGIHVNTGIPQGDEHNPHLETIMSSPSFEEPGYEMTT
ncbi:adhesion G protein-coupled receptor E2-like isoform X2 [Sycon ciliatum]|uniref:adhesion G protein-coupled receptor E2-like isoform X2 n=1 Tax=Sycon ciliatum TaxID=27933 RepID=UPI0031F6A13F